MTVLLTKGSTGKEVADLAKKLSEALGIDAGTFPVLASKPTVIDDNFDAAIRRWQSGIGVIADGIVGPHCQILLGMIQEKGKEFFETPLNVNNVCQLFPATKPANIARYLPYIESSLRVAGLTDRAMVVGALGTIRAETEGFVPISEFKSKFNTDPGERPFNRYDTRLGNTGAPDGESYRGRGFIQLTGKSNYKTYGSRIGVDLVTNPDFANAPEVAAVVLAEFLSDKADKFRTAVATGDLAKARKLVNGGAHGLARFEEVFALSLNTWPAITQVTTRAGKVARPTKAAKKPVVPVSQRPIAITQQSRTKKDAADLRDRLFMPAAFTLPDVFPPPAELQKFLPLYSKAGMILDQGGEGACTGFGLTCVVNYLRWVKAGNPAKFESVSPRMLYTLARRHDEYDGENYEGSSCRGALKGWFNNGVCLEQDWPYAPFKSSPAKYGFATRAAQNTLGVYYRIETKSITDMQAAIAQHRAVFVSAYTHAGWDNLPKPKRGALTHKILPAIDFDGRPSLINGHAFALVGFNETGFILQNSWGTSWGAGGFAILSYLDWLANGMDAWVVALGVPGVVAGRIAVTQGVGSALAGADHNKWWDKGLAYQHSILFGNDGRVSRYLTEDEQPRKLQQQAFTLPDAWFRQQGAGPKRLVIYAHGGLNKEGDAIKRASAMGRFFTGNGCYPLFLIWKTGLLESISNIFSEKLSGQPSRAGAGEWVSENTDLVIEKTIGRPFARPLWSEMKENAELAFAPRRGGELLLDAIEGLAATWKDEFEIHLVGHSAGSIILGHLLSAISKRSALAKSDRSSKIAISEKLKSVHLYAPACTVDFANRHYADAEVMNKLHIDLLSDKVERDDNVIAIYRKSLLYFVSNSLEADLRTPILGLERVFDPNYSGWDGSSDTGEALKTWRDAATEANLQERLFSLSDDRIHVATGADGKPVVDRAGHGTFDNDVGIVSRTLSRITGKEKLVYEVDDLRGY
ncbi:MAG: C1 family peptidase [Pseudomonadota bacterium]